MGGIEIIYPLIEKETGEGLYILLAGQAKYIAYIKDKSELDALRKIKDVIDADILEQRGVYLLKNIREVIHNSEEKTKKILKPILSKASKIELDVIKIFLLMITTYLIYQEIYLTAIIKDPTLINFFKGDKNNEDIELNILLNLFNYLIEYKGLTSKLNISEKDAEINASFKKLQEERDIFNKEKIDRDQIESLFNKIKNNFGLSEEHEKKDDDE